jgi:hypothetical protein
LLFYLPKKKGGRSCCFSLFSLAVRSLMSLDVGLSLIRMHHIKVRNTLVFSRPVRFIQGSFLNIKKERIDRFFPKNFSEKQKEDLIVQLLESWYKKRQREHER